MSCLLLFCLLSMVGQAHIPVPISGLKAVESPKLAWSTADGALGGLYKSPLVPSMDKKSVYLLSRGSEDGQHNISRISLVSDEGAGIRAGDVVATKLLSGGIGSGFGGYSEPFFNPSTGHVLLLGNFVNLVLYVYDSSTLDLLSTVQLPQWGLTYNACDMIPMSEMFQLPNSSVDSLIWVASLNSTNNATSVVGFTEQGEVMQNSTSFTPTSFIDHSNLHTCGFTKVVVNATTDRSSFDLFLGGYDFNKLSLTVGGELELKWLYSKTIKTPIYTYRFSFFRDWDVRDSFVALKTYLSRVGDCCIPTVAVLGAEKGEAMFVPQPLDGSPYPVFSKSGNTFAVGGRKALSVFQSSTGNLIWSLNTTGYFQDRALPVSHPQKETTSYWFGSERDPDPRNASRRIAKLLVFATENPVSPLEKILLGTFDGAFDVGECSYLTQVDGVPSTSGTLVLINCPIATNRARVFAIDPFPSSATPAPTREIEVNTYGASNTCSGSYTILKYNQGCNSQKSSSTLLYCSNGVLHSHLYSNSTTCSGTGSVHTQYTVDKCYSNPFSGSSLVVARCE